MIEGRDICCSMRENWMIAVPIILKMAKDCKAPAIAEVFKSYNSDQLSDDFGNFLPFNEVLFRMIIFIK